MAYEKTNITIYVTSKLFPGFGNVQPANKFIALEDGKVVANAGTISELAAKFGVRPAGLAKDENGIVHRTTARRVAA